MSSILSQLFLNPKYFVAAFSPPIIFYIELLLESDLYDVPVCVYVGEHSCSKIKNFHVALILYFVLFAAFRQLHDEYFSVIFSKAAPIIFLAFVALNARDLDGKTFVVHFFKNLVRICFKEEDVFASFLKRLYSAVYGYMI